MAQYGSPNRLPTNARSYSGASGHLTPESGHATGQRSWPQVPAHLKSFFVGLQQRQLDAIAFFLRNKEDIFSVEDASFTDKYEVAEDDKLQLLRDVMQLVFYTVEENSRQVQLWHFTEQMLSLVRDYLQKLTRAVLTRLQESQLSGKATEALQRDADHKLTMLTDYVEEVKGHIHVLERRRSKTQGQIGTIQSPEERRMGCVLSDKQRRLVNLWDSLDQRALTVEGILTGELSLLQTYLLHRYGRHAADLTHILETGLEEGLAFIYDRDIASAANMFINMGFDPDLKLHQICMYTVDRVLRDYLITELTKTGNLTGEEQEMVAYVQKLESLYSCPSYVVASQLKEEELRGSSSRRSTVDKVLCALKQDAERDFDLRSECGDIGPCDIVNSETTSYCQVILEWVRHWPARTRQKIILEHSLSRKELTSAQHIVPPIVVWEYLCCHLDVDRLQQWIRAQYPMIDSECDWIKQVTWPYDQPITKEMLSDLSHCPGFIKEGMLDFLARRGVFVPWEQNDVRLVQHRLARNGFIFEKPHLVERYRTRHGVSLLDIHYHIIKLCIEAHLPRLLYIYLDYWSLCVGAKDLTGVGIPLSSLPLWVSLLLQIRLIADLRDDYLHIYNTSLLPSLSHPSIKYTSVKDMLDNNLVVRAVATLAYCPEQYQQLIDDTDDATVQIFSAYPQLQHALFGERLVTGRKTPPLTVYDLLQNNAALDVKRLFGWQKTHTKVSDECCQHLPHFSYEPLVARYGHLETIETDYYLRQGRPCFAFCNMLSQLLQNEVKALPLSRINQECSQAFVLAVHNFFDQTIPPACVAFIEILGMDSASLRLYLEVANTISSYLTSAAADKSSKTIQKLQHFIACTLEECFTGNTECQQKVLLWLTGATYWRIRTLHLSRVGSAAGFIWQLTLLWCVQFGLPLDTHFLIDCAKDDSWQLFLTFAQIYNYPTEQLFPILEYFPSKNLRRHLVCIINAVHERHDDEECSAPDKHAKTKRSKRSRPQKKTATRADASGESECSVELTVSEEQSRTENTSAEMVKKYLPSVSDLLALLHIDLESPDPGYRLCTDAVRYKNPTPSIVAACLQDQSTVRSLISWLLACVPSSCGPFTNNYCVEFWSQWSMDTELEMLSKLIDLLITQSLEYLLYRALAVFLPDCQLLPFLQFVACIKDDQEKDKCLHQLLNFKQLYRKLRNSQPADQSDTSNMVFSITMIEDVVSKLTEQFLMRCQNLKRIETFLKCVDESSIFRFFHCKVTDVSTLLQLHQMTRHTGLSIDYVVMGNKDHPDHQQICDLFINSLLEQSCFSEAQLSAEILGLPHSSITLRQLRSEQEQLQASDMWSRAKDRQAYWNHCREMMARHHVAAPVAAQFFLEQVTLCKNNFECAIVYKLAYDCLCQNSDTEEAKETKEIFIKMWMCRIHDSLEKKNSASQSETRLACKLKKDELLTLDPRKLNFELVHRERLTEEEEEMLHVEIGRLLNRGCIGEAISVIRTFGYEDRDFNIVTTCLQLVKGLLKPEEIGADMRRIVAGPRPLSLRRISTTTAAFASTLSMVNISSLISQFDLESDGADHPVAATVQILSQQAIHAKHCAAFILTAYNISRVLYQRFDWVLMLEDFALIHRLLASDSINRYILAKGYIIAAGLEDAQVAGFLCDAIVEALQLWTGVVQQVVTSYGTDKPILLQPNIDQSGLRSNAGHGVQELLQLCVQPAVLGSRLLDTVTSIISSNMVTSRNVLTVEVELLVYAHDCFTLSCHMEGISAVLRMARNLTLILEDADEFILMISLLIGLARYNEMTYVFDILKQQHQFELLFRKGIDRDSRLRLAILDYLRRFHPHDLDTYSMAALNFTMYREIAGMLEEEARKELAQLKDRRLENTGQNQAILKKALRYYSDAAESYVKENCLRHAEKCVNEARLVALQTQLLSSNTSVLHLDREAVQNFVCKHAKFYESYIVCEAYGCQCFWSDAIYHQVIKGGSSRYLQELRNRVQLTPSLIEEVTQRFCQESQPTKQMCAQMKKLLLCCQDLCLLQKMAARVGLPDVTKEIIKAHPMTEAYLKDMGVTTTQ